MDPHLQDLGPVTSPICCGNVGTMAVGPVAAAGTDGTRAVNARSRVGLRLRPTAVRTRITAAVAVLSTLALSGAGLASYIVQSHRIDHEVTAAIATEQREFARLQHNGVNPATGKPYSSTTALIRAAMQNTVPQANQVLLAFWGGRSRLAQGADSTELGAYRPFVDAVAARMTSGGSFTVETPLGTVVGSVQPVSGGHHPSAFVVAYLLSAERAGLGQVLRTYAIVAAISVALVTAGAWAVASRLLRPVRDLRETAREITDTDLSRRISITGNDDLTDLAETFNAMLDRLEHSITTNRRFLDDAGHELRTPITIARGHLEVADPNNPADVVVSRNIALDELDRMSRMVDELIVLSHADQPDFLRIQPTDAEALTDVLLDKMRALGSRAWALDERGIGTVQVDPQRITQAVLELARNAFANTADGDVITLGSRIVGDSVQWWVRDTGHGLYPGEEGLIFERFRRGRSSTRTEGSGLGLSIVSAIAEAHGGRVDVSRNDGGGARFTISVPRGRVP